MIKYKKDIGNYTDNTTLEILKQEWADKNSFDAQDPAFMLLRINAIITYNFTIFLKHYFMYYLRCDLHPILPEVFDTVEKAHILKYFYES